MKKYSDIWNYLSVEKLQNTQLFEEMSPDGIRQIIFCSQARILQCDRGEYPFREGEKPENIYLLLSGKILITKDYIQGRRNIFFEIHENEIFGILINHKEEERYWYDTIAVMNSMILSIPWKFLFEFCSNVCIHHQNLLKNMVSVQADTCVYQMKKLHILSGVTLEAKIAFLMIDLADEQGYVDFKMNREELADYLGVSRPSLSRSLMLMKKDHLIEIKKSHAKILDADGLKKLWQKNKE